MIQIIQAAGWPIYPIILCSIVALGIIGERFYSLRHSVVAPEGLLNQILQAHKTNSLSTTKISELAENSLLGHVLVAGLENSEHSREIMRESIEEAGRAVAQELTKFLTTLGTIATMAPLLGLLGTIIGMIEIFGASSESGLTDPGRLAHGISIALYNAAFGIIVAVPALVFYRHFRSKADSLVVEMEIQAIKLVEIVHGERKA